MIPEKPITRKEMYLSAAAGQGTKLPVPATREEMYLDEIARNGGGGGTNDYPNLRNKPSINGVTLEGNKSSSELKISALSAVYDSATETLSLT